MSISLYGLVLLNLAILKRGTSRRNDELEITLVAYEAGVGFSQQVLARRMLENGRKYLLESAMPKRRFEENWYREPPSVEICPLCRRVIPPAQRDLHHVVPKSRGGRETVPLHRICHRQIHALFSESELAQGYSTIELLMGDEDMQRFVKWIGSKPPDFHERTRRSGRRRS